MESKTLTIDEKLVSAREGQTILEVAREHDIHIPTLCHMNGIGDIGACRVCVVEIAGSNKLAAACVTQVTEGMQVSTNTDRLKQYRRMIVELLMAEGNHICAVCVANGNCELQDLAAETGIDHIAGITHSRTGLSTTAITVWNRP